MLRRLGAVLVFIMMWAACDLGGGGGGGTGGGSGGGTGGGGGFDFKSGFTFVRKDDRNVYLADATDYQTTAVLTQSGTVHSPSLSKDGKRIVFVQGAGADSAIASVAVSGGSVSVVLAASAQVKNFKTPVYSPDGLKIAFTYDNGGVSSNLGLVNTDGSNFVALVGGGALAYALPSFSADGLTLLAAAGSTGSQLTQLERITIATKQAISVTNTLGIEAISIANRVVESADGTKAIFDARISTGVTRIFVINLSSKQVTKVNDYVGEPNTNDSFPTWVDASTLAFSSDSGGNDNVYKIGVDGTSRKLLMPKAIEPWYGAVAQ